MPGLEAFNHVRNVKPGPERSEGPLTAASQTIGRELEALPIFQGANREPDRSEGSGRALNWALTKDRARTGSMNRQLEC